MKEEDYKLKFIGDDWVFLPEDETKKKFQYDKLLYNIRRREQKIESDLEKIKNLKDELREMKKRRTIEYKELVKYHEKFTPKYTISMSKNKKVKNTDSDKGGFYTTGNRSWDCEVRVGGLRKPLYLGTNKSVTKYLDLIDDYEEYYVLLNPISQIKHYDLIRERLLELIPPIVTKILIKELKKKGSLDDWMDKEYKVKSINYLPRLYKKTEHYQPPKEKVKKESKGFYLGTNPKTGDSYYGKKKTKKQKEEELKRNK